LVMRSGKTKEFNGTMNSGLWGAIDIILVVIIEFIIIKLLRLICIFIPHNWFIINSFWFERAFF
jgi:hypothetical protein